MWLEIVRKAWRVLRREGLRSFIRKALMFLDDRTGLVCLLVAPYVAYKAKRLDLDELLDEMFSDKSIISTLYRPMQIRWEVERLAGMLRDLKPRYILEIGTARGGTLFIWTRVANEDALIISIDLPGGPFGGGYPLLKGFTYRLFARGRQRIVLVRGDSHSVETLRKVKRLLGERKLDFLFIDGDHSYEGVKKDFEMYTPLVRESGIIALHDIVPHPPETRCEVNRFWTEIKGLHKTIEIVRNREQRWAGIGVVLKRRVRNYGSDIKVARMTQNYQTMKR